MQNDDPRVISRSLDDVGVPGVTVEVDPDEAAALGAFEEDAITLGDALAANMDLGREGGAS